MNLVPSDYDPRYIIPAFKDHSSLATESMPQLKHCRCESLAHSIIQILLCSPIFSATAQTLAGRGPEADWQGLGPLQVQRPAIPYYVKIGNPTTR